MPTKKPARPKAVADSDAATTMQTVTLIGGRIRAARAAQGLTLLALSELTNLTPSMLSLVERGRSAPSIGSLILIAKALGVSMSELLPGTAAEESDVVIRSGSRPAAETSGRLLRSILRNDRQNGVLISITVYRPNTGASPAPRGHAGFEHGYVLEGELTVELEGTLHRLGPGDLISYASTRSHRIWNYSKRNAKALWFNLQLGRPIDHLIN